MSEDWRIFDFNQATGLRTDIDFDDKDRPRFRYTQHNQAHLDQNKRERDSFSKSDRIGEFAKVASIPAIVIIELRDKHGLDINNKNHAKAIVKKIETDYQYLKTRDIRI